MDDVLLRIAGAMAFILASFVINFLREISNSISQLNVNMAKILGEITVHEKTLTAHDGRLESLEKNGKSWR